MSATGHLSLPRDYLAKTVAASAAFQTWTGSLDAAAALAHVFKGEAPKDATFPLAVVNWTGSYDRKKIAGGASNQSEGRGALELLFVAAVAGSDSVEQAQDAFQNVVGAILADMDVLFGQAGYLDAESIAFMEAPQRTEFQEANSDTRGDFFECFLKVEFHAL